jgi:hypothetical protein
VGNEPSLSLQEFQSGRGQRPLPRHGSMTVDGGPLLLDNRAQIYLRLTGVDAEPARGPGHMRDPGAVDQKLARDTAKH